MQRACPPLAGGLPSAGVQGLPAVGGGVPLIPQNTPRAGGWESLPAAGGNRAHVAVLPGKDADATHRTQRLPKKAEGFIPQNRHTPAATTPTPPIAPNAS